MKKLFDTIKRNGKQKWHTIKDEFLWSTKNNQKMLKLSFFSTSFKVYEFWVMLYNFDHKKNSIYTQEKTV